MTDNVLMWTLNPTHSLTHSLTESVAGVRLSSGCRRTGAWPSVYGSRRQLCCCVRHSETSCSLVSHSTVIYWRLTATPPPSSLS